MNKSDDVLAIQRLVKKASKYQQNHKDKGNDFSKGFDIGFLYGLIEARELLIKRNLKKQR